MESTISAIAQLNFQPDSMRGKFRRHGNVEQFSKIQRFLYKLLILAVKRELYRIFVHFSIFKLQQSEKTILIEKSISYKGYHDHSPRLFPTVA